jgi:hypothetical protein
MTTDNVRVLKTGTCPSLSGKSKLTYEIGAAADSSICMRITKNSGAGMFGKGWVELERVHKLVNDKPITSTTLAPLFKGGSANSAGFLLAVMKQEGLVQPSDRAYERLDGKSFFAEIKALMGSPVKAAPKAPGTKASPTRPAVYISEIHGPLVPEPRKPAKRAPIKR